MEQRSPSLETARLRLRAYEERDSAALAELLTNEQIRRTYMIPELKTPERLQAMCRKLMEYSRSDEHFEYGICRKDTDELIGFLNDCELDTAQGICELGYVIHPRHWGKGYATEALQAAINELLRMGYRMIRACWFAENPASGRVMEKCGMTRLPGLREEVYQGQVHSVVSMELRKDD